MDSVWHLLLALATSPTLFAMMVVTALPNYDRDNAPSRARGRGPVGRRFH